MIEINLETDMLLVVDLQNDFVTGSLAVPEAKGIIPVINKYMEKIRRRTFSKDMHPANHSSFVEQGGPWPPHCVIDTEGVKLHSALKIAITFKSKYLKFMKAKSVDEPQIIVVEKGTEIDKDSYSAFDETGLDVILKGMGIKKLFICGLATEYCVKATVLDAIEMRDIKIHLLVDAIRAVNVNPNDGRAAIKEMIIAGASPIALEDIK